MQAHSGLQRASQTQNLPEHLLASAVGCGQGLDVCSASENHISAGRFLQEPRADLQKPGCRRPVHRVASRPSKGGVVWGFQFPHSSLRPASTTAHADAPAGLNTASPIPSTTHPFGLGTATENSSRPSLRGTSKQLIQQTGLVE